MIEINDIIIVEGTSDKNYLETFIKADILTCNGSAIDGFSIEFLKQVSKHRGIIILTDPDFPGTRIRNIISEQVSSCKHAFINKQKAIKNNKVGVAECEKEEIIKALKNVIGPSKKTNNVLLKESDLFELKLCGQNTKNRKEKIIEHYHLGHCNAKTLLKRLNMINVSKKELEVILNDKQ